MLSKLGLNKYYFLVFFVFLIALLSRVFGLNSDPTVFLDSGQVGDEGYWLYSARSLALFGHLALDNFFHDIAAAPLFSLTAYLSFLLFDVGFWQARIVSGLSGFLTVFITYLIAKPFGKKVALISTLLFEINSLMLFHNRLAVPESLSIFFVSLTVYLWLRSKPLLSGVSLAVALLSKTTAFLFLPSIFLIVAHGYFNGKINRTGVFRFIGGCAFFVFIIGLPIILLWGREFFLIYSTFGKWYVPTGNYTLFGNILNFFLHPFWGSPFVFPLIILTLINNLAVLFGKIKISYNHRILIIWLVGSVILTPLMSQVTNARLLPLLVPMCVLASLVIVNPKKYFLKLNSIEIRTRGAVFINLMTIVLTFPLSIVLAKFSLSLVKRVSGNEQVVNNLFYFSLLLFVLLSFVLIRLRKKWLVNSLFKFDILLLISLPVISLIYMSGNYLNFFNLISVNRNTLSIVGISTSLLLFVGIFSSLIIFRKLVAALFIVYVTTSLFGLSSILFVNSKNIYAASQRLEYYSNNKTVLGFFGHELSVENKSWPIYVAPRLNYVERVNFDYQKYDPKILFVPAVFDGRPFAKNGPWLTIEDINREVIFLEQLNLSRDFLGAKREVKLDVYEIGD